MAADDPSYVAPCDGEAGRGRRFSRGLCAMLVGRTKSSVEAAIVRHGGKSEKNLGGFEEMGSERKSGEGGLDMAKRCYDVSFEREQLDEKPFASPKGRSLKSTRVGACQSKASGTMSSPMALC